MFTKCNVFAISGETEWKLRLSAVLRQIGFRKIVRLNSAEQLSPSSFSQLNFLLMHSSMNKELIYKVTETVRASRDDNIRCMPIIVLLDIGLVSTVHEFINLGCDDLIIYPCSAKEICQRLITQVQTERDYFETPNYFGPDRRIHLPDKEHAERRDGMKSTYTHLVIKRSLSGGVEIISSRKNVPEKMKLAAG